MRRIGLGLLLASALALPAQAQGTTSAEIAARGIAPVADRLAALPSPAPEDRFALAGLRFLGAVERALQLRWRKGMSADATELPIFRLEIAENPAPEPFLPADVPALLTALNSDMAAARAALDGLESVDFGLEIRLGDLWFDVNGNGTRDPAEDVLAIAGLSLGRGGPGMADAVVRFDTADAAWLAAYTHLLQGFATLALAFDPAPAITRVLDGQAQMRALQGAAPPENALDMMFGRQVDRLAMVYFALQQQPDPALTRAARDHLLAMVAANRRFWALVEGETDNRAEWVPNDRQVSALGIEMPPGTGAAWQAVLADAEALLTGAKLIPHWRLGSGAGINLARMLDTPAPVDIPAWAQGTGILPWAETGPRVTPEAWRAFTRIVGGDSILFAVMLN
jgi:hypothetical protein